MLCSLKRLPVLKTRKRFRKMCWLCVGEIFCDPYDVKDEKGRNSLRTTVLKCDGHELWYNKIVNLDLPKEIAYRTCFFGNFFSESLSANDKNVKTKMFKLRFLKPSLQNFKFALFISSSFRLCGKLPGSDENKIFSALLAHLFLPVTLESVTYCKKGLTLISSLQKLFENHSSSQRTFLYSLCCKQKYVLPRGQCSKSEIIYY